MSGCGCSNCESKNTNIIKDHNDSSKHNKNHSDHDHNHAKKSKKDAIIKIIVLVISFAALVASFIMARKIDSLPKAFEYIDFGFIAVILCGYPIAFIAIKSLIRGKGFKGKVTSSLLITIAMLSCIALQILIYFGVGGDGHDHSYVFAAGEVAFLMYLGEIIEEFTVKKAGSGIEALVKAVPVTAKYMTESGIIEKPLSEVCVGDSVVVLPGDIISVDGVITSGETDVNQAVMTGESLPVDKKPGDYVYGGTLNGRGAITVTVDKAEGEMSVAKLKKLVEEAEGKKAPISRLAEKIARFIVPAAILTGIGIFLLNLIFLGKGIFAPTVLEAVERGVTMLVVFCPCALVLATPVAVAAGLGKAAKSGVLIKSGAALEEFGRVNSVAFDKTGTLTTGNLQVTDVIGFAKSADYCLQRAAATESLSTHPIARSIVAHAGEVSYKAENVKNTAGIGVEAVVDGHIITVTKWQRRDLSKDFENVSTEELLLAVTALSKGRGEFDPSRPHSSDDNHLTDNTDGFGADNDSAGQAEVACAAVGQRVLTTEERAKKNLFLLKTAMETEKKREYYKNRAFYYMQAAEKAAALLAEGKTVAEVTEDGITIGLIALSDGLRDGASEAVNELKNMGVGVYMLTGDNKKSAAGIAAAANIAPENVFASLMPQEKLAKVQTLTQNSKVCMVGDGINDAPALAAASCSVAMGALGSDAAIETADAALMSNNIKKVPFLLRLGRRVLRTVKINIVLSMTINVLAIFLSATGLLGPALGALLHNASSILVVLHSSFILMEKRRKH